MENPEYPPEPAAHSNDGFFKAIFSQPENATAFFKSHLPAAISNLIDWPSLTVLPGSFVKSSLQQVHSDDLLGLMLLYALHADSDLDVEAIYPTLRSNPELQKSTMSAAEKLMAKGRMEGLTQGISQGISQGVWVGRIQALQEFLDLPVTSRETLEALGPGDLESQHAELRSEYELRFKR